jgi:hypothetical protein
MVRAVTGRRIRVGFNTCRVFGQYLVWEADPNGFKQRFEQFLAFADKHGLTASNGERMITKSAVGRLIRIGVRGTGL